MAVQLEATTYRPVIALPPGPEKKAKKGGQSPNTQSAPTPGFDWTALFQPRALTGASVTVRVAPKAEVVAEEPVEAKATAELKRLSQELRTAIRLLPMAQQVAGIEDYHLGDVQYEPPAKAIEQHLTRLIVRAQSLAKEGHVSGEAVDKLQEGAIKLLSGEIFAEVKADLEKLEQKQSLVPWDRQQVEWALIKMRPIGDALKHVDGEGDGVSAVRDELAALTLRLYEVARRPLQPPVTQPVDPQVIEANTKALLAKLDFGPKEDAWKRWAAMDRVTIDVWRGLMADGLALLQRDGDHLDLDMQVGRGLVHRGLKQLNYLFESASANALQGDNAEQQGVYKALAQDAGELILRALLHRGSELIGRGAAANAVYLLAEPLGSISQAKGLDGSRGFDDALGQAKALYQATLPKVLEQGRALVKAAELELAAGKPGYAEKREAESLLIQLRSVPPETAGLAELILSLRQLYTRVHLNELKSEVAAGRKALADLVAAGEQPGEAILEEARTSQQVAEMGSWKSPNPHLVPELLGDKPGLIGELGALALALKTAISNAPG